MRLPEWLKDRSAGVLLHPTSLPGGHGIGCLGKEAYQWVDFLADAGFSYWQMCPVGPTGYGDSPYQVFASSAGNPYLVDWEPLLALGYIKPDELPASTQHENQVRYGDLYKSYYPAMRIAFRRFNQDPQPLIQRYGDFIDFITEAKDWLEPYGQFQALKSKNELKAWWLWPEKDKSGDSLDRNEIKEEIIFQSFIQFIFRSQWNELHQYAQSKKISLIGDLPIYVAPDSADAWQNKNLFQISHRDEFTNLAGVPPDYFNEKGQLWGNPLYNWSENKKENYRWWIQRIKDQLELFEVIRIDHFRAFHDYWTIPQDSTDAISGKWERGPGLDFWSKVSKAFPSLPFLAEDLGDISKGVRKLRNDVGLPGMAVLQFAFDGNPKNLYLPHNLKQDMVLYTGTHDNDTSLGWYQSSSESAQSFFRSYLGVDGSTPGWDMLRHAYRSVSQLVIIPAQDLLSLGGDARFNTPGEASGNWNWRMSHAQFEVLRKHSTNYLKEQANLAGRHSNA